MKPAQFGILKSACGTGALIALLSVAPEAHVPWSEVTSDAPWSARRRPAALHYDGKLWVLGGRDDSDVALNDVWCSEDGASWTLVTSAAAWPARDIAGALVHDGKMWIIGGRDYYPSPLFNDVWYSTDGVVWTQATAAAPWSARYGGKCLSFDGKIWLLGGRSASGYQSDVWSSEDGVSWTQEASSVTTAWPGAASHHATTFDGRMWIAGGWTGSGFSDDVYSSSDGISWTLVTGQPGWEGRGHCGLLQFAGRLWVLGGANDQTNPGPFNDVWSTTDGQQWTVHPTSPAPWAARNSHATVVHDGKIWVLAGIGGPFGSGTNLNDVWSGDLTHLAWSPATSSAPWSARRKPSVVQYDGKLWVLGGRDDSDVALNDVWCSEDGASWTLVTSAAAWPARDIAGALVHDGKMWIIGGRDYYPSPLFNDVWYSTDGAVWTQATAAAPWSARYGGKCLSFDGKIWLLGGRSASGYQSDVWSSEDGVSWTQEASSATTAWPGAASHHATTFDGRMWIAGGWTGSGFSDDVYSSSDGISWTLVTGQPGWEGRGHCGLLQFAGRLWVLGGANDQTNPGPFNDVWSTTDGQQWTVHPTSPAPWAARNSHATVVHDGKIWVLAGIGGPFGSGTSLNDVWYLEERAAAAVETVRLGIPPNPQAFLAGVTSGPIVGATWDPRIDHSSFASSAAADFVGVSLVGPLNHPTGMGTLLIGLPVLNPIALNFTPGSPFAISVPDDPYLIGTPVFTQGGSFTPGVGIELANALDIVVGCF